MSVVPAGGSEMAGVAAADTRPHRVVPSLQQAVLMFVAGWVAWRPVETFPSSSVVVSAAVLVVLSWGWRRTRSAGAALTVIGVVFLLMVSGLSGLDPAASISRGGLLATVLAMIWLASREAPPETWPAVLAMILSGLALWAVLQVTAGPEHVAAIVDQMPEALRSAARERLESGRGFASQPLPSHLAVLLATALPLLLVRLRWKLRAVPWAAAAGLCVVGLAVTKSPVGIALALTACVVLAAVRGGRFVVVVAVVLAVALVGVILVRGDVSGLEPVHLRFDNWRTALWVWSTAPAAGVGFGGFGQAAQAVPFEVGNRPRHAHSLPLEWLAELGPLGLVAALTMAAAITGLALRIWPLRPALAVAVAIVPVHNLVDFSLLGSGVAVPWAVLVGWAAAEIRAPACQENSASFRPAATTLAALALAVTALHATSIVVLDAAASRESPAERFAGALRAQRLAPWRTEALGPVAVAALESGDSELIDAAAAELERSRWLRPHSASLADLRSRLAVAQARIPSAVAEAWAAQRANPANPVYGRRLSGMLNRLQETRDAAGH